MKKRNILAFIVVIIIVILLIALTLSKRTVQQPTTPTPTTADAALLSSATYSYYGDTFTLAGGQVLIQGHAFSSTTTSTLSLSPVSYMLAATSTGTLADGTSVAVAAAYRSFGANIIEPVLFAFTQNADGSLTQLASSDILTEEDAKIQSVSVTNGTISLNLVVVSAADQQKPHYEQTPTQPETLQFTISGNQILPITQ